MTDGLRIAVADDEPEMRDFFEKVLPRFGHQVVAVAENGNQLVSHCRELKPDLVITDIKMPELEQLIAGMKSRSIDEEESRQMFEAFAAKLKTHECGENRLVQYAFGGDESDFDVEGNE